METQKRTLFSLLIFLILLPFSIAYILKINIPVVDEIFGYIEDFLFYQDAGYIWGSIIGYLIIACTVCMIVRIFKPLKSLLECGLIDFLTLGIFFGIFFKSFIYGEVLPIFTIVFLLGLIGELSYNPKTKKE